MSTNFNKKGSAEFWINGISAVIFVCSVFLLLDERFIFRSMDTNDHSHLEPIAQVLTHQNDVRRRFDKDVIWLPVQKQDVVFKDESIFTGDSSEIEIKFNADDTKISLGSKTLVKLTSANEKNSLSVLHGRVKVSLGKKKNAVFQIAGKTYNFSAPLGQTVQTSFEIEAPTNEKDSPKIEVTQGSLEVFNTAKQAEKTVIPEHHTAEMPTEAEASSPLRSIASVSTDEPTPPIAQENSENNLQEGESTQPSPVQIKNKTALLIELNKIPDPVPAPEVTPSPLPSVAAPENKAFSTFSVAPYFSNSTMSVTEVSSATSCELISKVNMGLDLSWAQNWSKNIETKISLSFIKFDYEQPPTRTLSSSSLITAHGSIAGTYRLFERTKLSASVMESQQIFVRAVSNSTLSLDRQWIPSFSSNISQEIVRVGPLTFGLGADVGAYLPKSADAYNIKFGYSYGGDLFLVHSTNKGQIGAIVLFQNKTQNTNLVKQTNPRIFTSVDSVIKLWKLNFQTANRQYNQRTFDAFYFTSLLAIMRIRLRGANGTQSQILLAL